MPALNRNAIRPSDPHGIVRIVNDAPAHLTMPMKALRPEATYTSDDDDVVLVMFCYTEPETSLRGHWRLSASEVTMSSKEPSTSRPCTRTGASLCDNCWKIPTACNSRRHHKDASPPIIHGVAQPA